MTTFAPTDIAAVIARTIDRSKVVGRGKQPRYYDYAAAFDIEVSSFYEGREKRAIMYVWQMAIEDCVIIGRTWDEWLSVLTRLSEILELSERRRLLVYVHNLSYEFQFIRSRLDWLAVFALDDRKPVYALSSLGIEFRCSYILSGYSLDNLGAHLVSHEVRKASGALDYSLIRHAGTPLDAAELDYCANDVLTVTAYIREQIDQCGAINRIPLTNTGFVRNHIRAACLHTRSGRNGDYADTMGELRIRTMDEYRALRRAFSGGYTHANASHVNDTLERVSSQDFTSSYPAVMVAEKYPMSRACVIDHCTKEQFALYLTKYCCIFDVEFSGLMARNSIHPLSAAHCLRLDGSTQDNGRVVCASYAVTTVTNVDWSVISKCYQWTAARIGRMYCYRKEYLPTPFVRSILQLYEDKTQLKGVKGRESDYLRSKGMLNSCYGMCVTDPLRDVVEYSGGEWSTRRQDDSEQVDSIRRYNDSPRRCLSYAWGVWVTAYARRNLFTAIAELGDDFVYADTDSVKYLDADRHAAYFAAYNARISDKLRRACHWHGIDPDMIAPKTVNGVPKPLGVWDYEGCYDRFKTLGAKRYMVDEGGELSLTVSGVNKTAAVPYLMAHYPDPFAAFSEGLEIPPVATGKNLHTYIDYPVRGTLVDYLGNVCQYEELSGVHLEPTGYTMSLSVMYLDYLLGLKLSDNE